MNTRPTISAVIPVHNRAHVVARAIDSILAQSLPPEEIVVVDDHSHDDLEAALAPYGERVRLVRHDRRRGAAAARNTGIAEASGAFIAFLDSDDLWRPTKLERQLAFMQRAGLSACCTGFEVFPRGNPQAARPARRAYAKNVRLEDLAWGCYVAPGATLVCSRRALMSIDGYCTDFACYEDWDMLIRLLVAEGQPLGYVDERLSGIEKGGNRSPAEIGRSLQEIKQRHLPTFESHGLGNRFLAGLAFNRAALCAASGDFLGTARHLVQSLALHPKNHWPIRNVLASRVNLALHP